MKLRGDRRSEDDFRAQANDFIDREAIEELGILLKSFFFFNGIITHNFSKLLFFLS